MNQSSNNNDCGCNDYSLLTANTGIAAISTGSSSLSGSNATTVITTVGTLAYYQSNALLNDFYYVEPGDANDLLIGAQLAIQGNLSLNYDAATDTSRIYFVGHQYVANWYYIYCLTETPSGWVLTSPSNSSSTPLFSTAQSAPAGIIAISPDDTTIAYFGAMPTPFVFYFSTADRVHFTFNNTVIAGYAAGENSLQFTSDNDIYYISIYHSCVQYLNYSEAYCGNPAVSAWPSP